MLFVGEITLPSVPLSYDAFAASGGQSGVVSAAPATVFEFFGFNNNPAPLYFFIFDAVAVPADGFVPLIMPILVPPAQHFSLVYSQGRAFAAGVAWSGSSTSATLTGVAGFKVNCQYDP